MTDQLPKYKELLEEGQRRQETVDAMNLTEEEKFQIANEYAERNPDNSTVILYKECFTIDIPEKQKLKLLFANFLVYRSFNNE